MKERRIKYRIFTEGQFSYWGFIEEEGSLHFASIIHNTGRPITIAEAQRRSEPFLFLDKSGNEVYEGDIVEQVHENSGWYEKEWWKGVVVLNEYGRPFLHAYEHHWITKEKETRGGLTGLDLHVYFNYRHYTFQVIGNIHEHEYLLNEAKAHGWKLFGKDDQ